MIRPINTNKNEEFKKYLLPAVDDVRPRRETAEDPPPLPEAAASKERQTEAEGDPSRALAPDEQSSWGRGNLDPAEWLSTITAPGGAAPVPVEPSAAGRAREPELSELVEGWVRRLAVGGDQRRSVARLDIGHGAYAGAELIIAAEGGAIQVELTLPEGAPASGLSERLTSRLTARGYTADVAVR